MNLALLAKLQVDALESNYGCAVCAQRSLMDLPVGVYGRIINPPRSKLLCAADANASKLAEENKILEEKLVGMMQARESEIQTAIKVMSPFACAQLASCALTDAACCRNEKKSILPQSSASVSVLLWRSIQTKGCQACQQSILPMMNLLLVHSTHPCSILVSDWECWSKWA
jgi:hypothetical protein